MRKLTLVAITSTLLLGGCSAYKYDHHSESRSGHMQDEHMGGGHMDGHDHGSSENLAGKPGKATDVDRVIEVTADDNMRFVHAPLNVKEGETIKFIITNNGAVPHEFSIATKDEHMEHGAMMMSNPDMHHGPGGNTVTVQPGATQELIWLFENAWQIEAACNIPGHYQAGMHSPVTVEE